MKASIFHEPGHISLEDVSTPEPGPGEILMRVRATAICASDIRVYRGEKRASPGVIQGHETAGEVALVGEGIDGFVVGDRITLYPIIACGRCIYCLEGQRNRCETRTTIGYEENGGLAEYLLIPASLVRLGHVMKLPPGLSFDIASLTEPMACCLNSLETCRAKAGGSVVVLGAGPMGAMHVILARALGCAQIIVSEPLAPRRTIARELGADLCVDPRAQDLRQAVLEATDGLGADVVIVSIGIPSLIEESLGLVRKQGWVNLFAGCPPGSQVRLDPNRIHGDELRITGTQNATPDQFRRTLALLPLLHGVDKLITHRFPLAQTLRAFDLRLGMEGLKPVVVPDLQEGSR